MTGVLIVDDNPIVRAALRLYLDDAGEVRIVAEACDGREALAAVRRFHPEVTLLDHRMPVADGLSVIRELAERTAVLVLTSDSSADLIRDMLRAGARGYLVHGEFDPPELLRAVKAAAAGQGWLSPTAASVAAAELREHESREHADHERQAERLRARARFGLTRREQDILVLVCEGLPNAVIARRLALAEKTVKNHLHHVFAKMQVGTRTEAVARWTGGR
jgi:DNA-binding NarL/FixJ family response regulator